MKFLKSAGLLAFLILSSGASQAASVIDFEDWMGGGGSQTSVSSGGYTFVRSNSTPNGNLFVSPHPTGGNPTQSLHTDSVISFSMTKDGGGQFSIFSVDLQEGLSSPDTSYIVLTGIGPSGGVIGKEMFPLDGNANTYQTFRPTQLTNVVRVLFEPHGGHQLMSVDNIVVPEPGTLGILLVGVALARRRF